MVAKHTYDESSFQHFSGLKAVRAKPSMYIGDTGASGLFTIIREPLDNSVDENLAARNDYIGIHFDTKTGEVTIWDTGAGIPVGKKKFESGTLSTLEVAVGKLHGGAKMNDKAYAVSRGCLIGSTAIELVDGRTLTIKDLFTEYLAGKVNYVWSVDRITGELHAQPIEAVQRTKKTKKLVEVTFNTGASLVSTPDHPLYTDALEKLPAVKSLGRPVFAINFKVDSDGHKEYYRIVDNQVLSDRLDCTVASYYGIDMDTPGYRFNPDVYDLTPDNLRKTPFQETRAEVSSGWMPDAQGTAKQQIDAAIIILDSYRGIDRIALRKDLDKLGAMGLHKWLEGTGRSRCQDLCQYIDLDEFILAYLSNFDPSDYLYRNQSQKEQEIRSHKWTRALALHQAFYWNANPYGKTATRLLQKLGVRPTLPAAAFRGVERVSQKSAIDLATTATFFTTSTPLTKELHLPRETNDLIVTSVRKMTMPQEVSVYDLIVPVDHNYRLDCGVIVGNTHGVGVKATNALSTHFAVFTKRDKKWYTMQYRKGTKVLGVTRIASKSIPRLPGKAVKKVGTIMQFTPDMSIFSVKTFPFKRLYDWANITSYLAPGLLIEMYEDASKKPKKSWLQEDFSDYIIGAMFRKLGIPEAEAVQLGNGIAFFDYSSPSIDIGLTFTDNDGAVIEGFTNALVNSEGGTHIAQLLKMYSRILKPYAKTGISAEDLRDGLVGIVNVKLATPEFSSQHKDRLTDKRALDIVDSAEEGLAEFFAKNKSLAKQLCKRAKEFGKLREKQKMERKALATLGSSKRAAQTISPKKFVAPNYTDFKPEDCEIFLVEGDSAGGCFTGDTMVRMSNGTTLSFERMVNRHTGGQIFKGMGYDIEKGNYMEFTFQEPRITKTVTELTEIGINGVLVACTMDHPWLTHRLQYVAAKDLEVGTKMLKGPYQGIGVPDFLKVTSVKKIQLDTPVEVYDATSPEMHNFTLACGAVVHNTARKARFQNQGVFSLKGKIPNVYKLKNAMAQQDILNILLAIGVNPRLPDPLSKLRTGKLVFLTDPDVDGYHISYLLLGMLVKLVPDIFKRNLVYSVLSPEYMATYKGQRWWGQSANEARKQCPNPKAARITHIKGYGEINAAQLREVAFADTRKLIRIMGLSKGDIHEVESLMGSDAEPRRKLLTEDIT